MTSAGAISGAAPEVLLTVADDHTYAAGDQIEVANVTFICNDATATTGCNDFEPTAANCTGADDSPWAMKLSIDTSNISAEMAEKYIADDASCTPWVAGMSWIELQWACDDTNDR
jgi:hypothetical protein